MRKILPILFVLICSQDLSAQLKGVVIDSAGKSPLERAVIGLVVKSHITDTSYTITDDKGQFSFGIVPSSAFSIVITNIGYRPVAKFVPVNSPEKMIDLGNIPIANMVMVLGEVVIESAPITIREDTIEYRASAFKVKDNAVVEDLLKKLPGVQVDKDGNIKAQGKDITRVKVNGKDFFGGDPKTATRELPANIVDKIQITDDYGDQATVSGIKDGDAQKVMNIQLKKDKNTGLFGKAEAGVGDQGRYESSVSGNYFNNSQQVSLFGNSNNVNQSMFSGGNTGGTSLAKSGLETGGPARINNGGSTGPDGITTANSIGVNYRDDWGEGLSVYGSYMYGHTSNNGSRITSQQNIYSNTSFLNDQNNQFTSAGDNHRFYINVEYIIDSLDYVKISPVINYTTGNGTNNVVFDYFADSIGKTSQGFNNNITHYNNATVTGNILYNHRFRKRGRNFSVNFNVGRSDINSDLQSDNNAVQFVPPATTINSSTFNPQVNVNYNYNIRFTYSEPLSKTRSLDLAYSHNFSYTNNNRSTYDINGPGIPVFDPQLSNNYENNYFTDRANVSIRTTEKKYNYTLGISILPVDLRGFSITKDSSYSPIKRVNIFPVARFAYNFSKMRSLTISYRGDAQQPTFNQLQDVLDISNPQYLVRGNPDLKPALNHNISLSYNNFNFLTGTVLFTTLTFNAIQNQIVNNVSLLNTSGTQLSTPQNVNGYYNASGFYSFSQPLKNRRYILSLNGSLNYNHNINLIDSLKSIGKNLVAAQGFNFDLNFTDWLEIQLGTNYTLNLIKYTNAAPNSSLQGQQFDSWLITSSVNIDLSKDWVLKYDLNYAVNNGLTGSIAKNPAILNASLEKQVFKKKNGIIRLQAFDIFDQNSNISRTITYNSIIDSRSNRLTRYFMLSFTYRLQKFAGKHP